MNRPSHLFIHAGLPKTGTTALQHWLHDNPKVLEASGISYPDPLTEADPKHIAVTRQLRRNPAMPVLQTMLRATKTQSMLLSNEGFSNHLPDFNVDSLARFRELTAGCDTTIILMSRDPEAWLRSYHKQCVLNPGNGSHPLWGTSQTRDEIRPHPRVRALMDIPRLKQDLAWAFGARQVREIDFDDSDWFGQFQAATGLEGTNLPALPRINESLPDWATETLRQVNARLRKDSDRQVWRRLLQTHLKTAHATSAKTPSGAEPEPNTLSVIQTVTLPASMPRKDHEALARFQDSLPWDRAATKVM